jgi:ubiquinone/menaquinone biosynthesis C-methylase UbiE
LKEQSIFTNLNFMNKKMIENLVKNGDTVVDATLGNGHDALFLGKLIGPEGKLLGFDIQNVAVKKSSKRMKDEGISNYSFINESHAARIYLKTLKQKLLKIPPVQPLRLFWLYFSR